MSAQAVDAHQAGASTGRVLGIVLLSLATPGLGHIRLGRWQLGLIMVALAQCLIVGVRAVPYLLAPTPKALLLVAAVGIALLIFILAVTLHALWLARREFVEVRTIDRTAGTYVPLPLDVRVREAGPSLTEEDGPRRPITPWFTAGFLMAAGVACAVQLPARWAMVTMPQIAMAPNLAAGDRVMVDLHRVALPPRRGEIVLLRSRDADAPFLVRRVIALPGDRVVLSRMTLMLNGNRLSPVATAKTIMIDGIERPIFTETLPSVEPYAILPNVGSTMIDEARLIVMQPGKLFVMRDDRATPVSTAGSVSGLAPIDEIEGIATTVLWQRGGGFLHRL